jgi:hypothetical protein
MSFFHMIKSNITFNKLVAPYPSPTTCALTRALPSLVPTEILINAHSVLSLAINTRPAHVLNEFRDASTTQYHLALYYKPSIDRRRVLTKCTIAVNELSKFWLN